MPYNNMIVYFLLKEISMLDYIYKISMIVIASVNVIFAFFIFCRNNKEQAKSRVKSQNIDWFKSLILNHHLDDCYAFYTNIHKESENIKKATSDINDRIQTNENLAVLFSNLRIKTLELFSVADDKLYKNLLKDLDKLQDLLSEKMSDIRIDFSVSDNFDKFIEKEIFKSRTLFVKTLFSYKG